MKVYTFNGPDVSYKGRGTWTSESATSNLWTVFVTTAVTSRSSVACTSPASVSALSILVIIF